MKSIAKGNIKYTKIKVDGHPMNVEIYLSLEGVKGTLFEIFPTTIEGMNFSFENKDKLYKLVKNKFINEKK